MTELPTIQLDLRQHFNNTHFRTIKKLTFLLDSGTNRSLIVSTALKGSEIKTSTLEKPLRVSNAFNNESQPIIFEDLKANIFFPANQKELPNQRLLVVQAPLQYDGIIGMDILSNRTIKFGIKPIIVNKLQIQEPEKDPVVFVNTTNVSETNKGVVATIISNEDAMLQPFSFQYVKCSTRWTDKSVKPKTLYLMATEAVEKANCGFSEKHLSNRNLLRIFNNSDKITFIPKNSTIANGFDQSQYLLSEDQFKVIANYLMLKSEASADDQKTLEKEARDWEEKRKLLLQSIPITAGIEKTLDSVPSYHRKELKSSLEKFNSIFSRHANDSGLNGSFLVDLRLKDKTNTEPTFCRPYKLDPEIEEKLAEKCREMQESGILETCSSAWNSPALAIKKKNGQIRLVNNYSTGVNERLVCTNYPIPPIRSLNASISATITEIRRKSPNEEIFFSSVDLKNGFYCLALAKSARDKTAFIISQKQFRYARLSMGLALSPSVFQHFLHQLFMKEPLGIDGAVLLNYLDDFLIISGASNHQAALDTFFAKCEKNKVLLSLEKCNFYQKQTEFLGLVVSAEGFKAKPAKIEALLRFGYPTTRQEAQRIMGSFNFFTRQVPRVTALLDPFAKAVAKKEFKQTELMRKSLDALKEVLKQGAVTAHLDYSTENDNVIFLATDCSLKTCGFALGNATLTKDDVLTIKSISHYGSKALDDVCMLLSARARELIGLATGLDTFRDLLPVSLGFVALVDHRSLMTVAKAKGLGKTSANTRARNALATVLNYPKLRILYVPGTEPILRVVDGLSRPALDELKYLQTEEVDAKNLDPRTELPTDVSVNNMETVEISKSKLMEEQKLDPDLIPIFKDLGNKDQTVVGKKHYFLQEGILMAQVGSGAILTVVPSSLAKALVDILHIQTLHAGERRLLQAVNKSNFLLKGKMKLVKDATRQCIFCQTALTSKFRREPNIDVPIRPSLTPWKRVAVDLMDITYGSSSCYLLTFVCVFSRFCDCEIINKKSADVMVPALINLITRNGGEFVMEIGSDKGREFINSSISAAYKSLNIFGHSQSAYNSRANICERTHKELRMLMKVLEPNATDFKFKTKICVNFYNSQPQERLGNRSPREVLTGCAPRRLLSHLHPEDKEPSNIFENPEIEDYSKWEEYLTALHNEHALREIQRYNSIIIPKSNFEAGDLVMCLDPVIQLSKSKAPRATGPYIVERVSKNTLTLRHVIDHSRIVRNARFVRRMSLSDEQKNLLIEHQQTTWRDGKILTPKLLQSAEQLRIKLDETNNQEQRYLLRSRK